VSPGGERLLICIINLIISLIVETALVTRVVLFARSHHMVSSLVVRVDLLFWQAPYVHFCESLLDVNAIRTLLG